MKVLVVNCGSSSLKYQLFEMDDESVLAKGVVERIGLDGSVLIHEPTGKDKVKINTEIKNHTIATGLVLEALVDAKHGVISSMEEIKAIGNRIVHGGEHFSKSVLVTPDVIKAMEDCIDMAPLHTPPNVAGIIACGELMPSVPQVVVFDTAFHQTMPKKAYMYALPYEAYEKYAIRRYGFHGTSHNYVAQRATAMMGKDIKDLKIITCHLGNGSSVTAIKNGQCIDTSMGFTPLAGLAMGTRCGDVDPAIIPFLMKKEQMTAADMDTYINKKSGVLGISGVSSDFRDIEKAAADGNERAQLALDMFTYEVVKFIGSYVAALKGVDAIVFTAGVGENAIDLRAKIIAGVEYLGTKIDNEKNNMRGKEREISADGSKVKVFVIPTNEELVIARDTEEICKTL